MTEIGKNHVCTNVLFEISHPHMLTVVGTKGHES